MTYQTTSVCSGQLSRQWTLMSVAMAPPLYTSTVKEKLYSCDDNGAHTFWERWWVDIEGEYPGESSHS